MVEDLNGGNDTFERHLSDGFVEALRRMPDRCWWRDVLADKTLLIAPRGKSLNVYWQGQSIFRATYVGGSVRVTTHEKFLLDPDLAGQVQLLPDGSFDLAKLLKDGFMGPYEGPQTLAKMKRAAGVFAKGEEKSGCHAISVRNPTVLDVEIAFPGWFNFDGKRMRSPRVDMATIEPDGAAARLVFWEAKDFSNKELRIGSEELDAPVCAQVRRYGLILDQHRKRIQESYSKVAANLVAFSEMGWKRKLSDIITAVAADPRALSIPPKPDVGLVIFGFDRPQKLDPDWQKQLKKLESRIERVLPVGKASDIILRNPKSRGRT